MTTSTEEIFLNNSRVCCVSDIHIGIHQNSLLWHNITIDWARWLAQELGNKGVTDIIISGDFFHYRDEIAVNTIHFVTDVLDIWREFNIVMLVGNHDAYYKDKSDVNSLSILSGWTNIKVISTLKNVHLFNRSVTFCPWGTSIKDIPECDVIFGHFEISSFKQNSYKVCDTGIITVELLQRAGMVISGHFHLRDERNYDNGNIVYLGNPFQMDFGDAGSTKGYYILDFETLKYEFTENKKSPTHHKVLLSELAEIGCINAEVRDTFNNNFIKLVIDRAISSDEIDILLTKFQTLSPIHISVDYAINFSKYKLDEDLIKDFSGVDIPTAIEEFIELMDIDNKKEVTDHTLDLFRRCS
jgi:DNA repair exonuclease SbcCD nuclease subunit